MTSLQTQVDQAVSYLQGRAKLQPDLLLILGSGWGQFVQALEVQARIPYAEIPHFPVATVLGHGNELIFAEYQTKSLLVLTGRFHYYEGYSLVETTFPVRVAAQLGVRGFIATNAAGGLHTFFYPGDLLVIRDHLNLIGDSPLRGMAGAAFGSRFVDLSNAYDLAWQSLAQTTAENLGLRCHPGVYAVVPGPNYETPAEIKMLQLLGADAVGMSTVPEVIVARQMGLRVLALSCITNLGAGISAQPVNHGEVLTVGQSMSQSFRLYLGAILAEITL